MSRATVTKSRADKGKPPAAQTPVIAHEIVPGKFNDHDWNLMLENDSTEEYIMDIVDEVVEMAMTQIHENYMENQLLPYTISQAKDAILQIIEWQFLARDDGEFNAVTDVGWMQDEEPDPAMTDCWAQGSVPKSYIALSSMVLDEATFEEEPQIEEKMISVEKVDGDDEEPELEDKVSDTEEPVQPEPEPRQESQPESPHMEPTKKKKIKFRPYRGKMKSAGVKQMVESLEESEMKLFIMDAIADSQLSEERNGGMLNMPVSCQSLLKDETETFSQVQAGRPPGSKDVEYDDMGNVVAVVKLDPEKLPNHRVQVKYHVIDPAIEAAQARLEAMRHGKYIAPTVPTMVRAKSKKSVSSEACSTIKSSKTSKGSQKATITSLPPSIIDAMEIAPGVIVKEGGRVRKGPGRYIRRVDMLDEHQNKLRPVTTRIHSSAINVADLLDRHTPILRRLNEPAPLPPIIPSPPLRPSVSS